MRDLLQLQKGKKGQAAMEFLMTYGWALLVVLVAIGALAFFGVLNPGQFLPDQCTFFAGVTCSSLKADASDNNVVFTIQNGLGYTLYNLDYTLVMSNGATTPSFANPSCATTQLNDGASTVCTAVAGATQLTSAAGTRYKLTPTLTWNEGSATGTPRSRAGSISVTVEA